MGKRSRPCLWSSLSLAALKSKSYIEPLAQLRPAPQLPTVRAAAAQHVNIVSARLGMTSLAAQVEKIFQQSDRMKG
jgi:hypothetical protein